MRIRSFFVAAACGLLLLLTAAPARADITGFLGVNATPTNRPVKGLAIGVGLLIVGFEFEYGQNGEDLSDTTQPAPGLRTFMFNGLVQTPFAISGIQPYATAGGGIYRESLSTEPNATETNLGLNIGGGAKVSLAGPLRLRLDYRVLTLKGSARHATVQRFYAGINLKF